jgi:hypothetical protein
LAALWGTLIQLAVSSFNWIDRVMEYVGKKSGQDVELRSIQNRMVEGQDDHRVKKKPPLTSTDIGPLQLLTEQPIQKTGQQSWQGCSRERTYLSRRGQQTTSTGSLVDRRRFGHVDVVGGSKCSHM